MLFRLTPAQRTIKNAPLDTTKWEREKWRDLGRMAVTTEDLDTSYSILVGAMKCGALPRTREVALRYIQAYCLLKQNGLAFWALDENATPLPPPFGNTYWDRLMFAVQGKGSDHQAARAAYGGRFYYTGITRHMNTTDRAIAAISGAREREERGRGMIYGITELGVKDRPLPYATFRDFCKSHYMFGETQVEKALCFADAMGLREVDYSTCTLLTMSCIEGAEFMYGIKAARNADGDKIVTPDVKAKAIQLLRDETTNPYWADLKAPPLFNRPLRFQEFETMACMVKRYFKRGFPIGGEIFIKTRMVREFAPVSPVCREVLKWCEERWPDYCG